MPDCPIITSWMKRGKHRGFTLVELLVVIVIIAILAAIATPMVSNANQRTQQSGIAGQLKVINNAVNYFYNDTGNWPKNLNDLSGPNAPPNGVDSSGHDHPLPHGSYHGPYLSAPSIPTSLQKYIAYNGLPGVATYDSTGTSPPDGGPLPR